MRDRLSILLAVVAMLALLSSCGVTGLSFVQDERVSITAPRDRAEVTLPVTVRWTVEDFDGTFAVFVDRQSLPPGRALEWLARDDDLCSSTPGCPATQWFEGRDVYLTADTELTLEELPDLTRDDRRDFHEVTVVLIDRNGVRAGEGAFSVEFEVKR